MAKKCEACNGRGEDEMWSSEEGSWYEECEWCEGSGRQLD